MELMTADRNTLFPIGLGTMGMGGYYVQNRVSDQKCLSSIRYAMDCGINLIDTAEVYGDGHGEELIGQAVGQAREHVFLATKFSPAHNRYADVLSAAEGSLRRLKTDYIDLYQVHWPNPQIPIEETMRALEQLLADGKIRFVGLSNFSKKEFQEAQACFSAQIVSLQAEYNLFDRYADLELLGLCQMESVRFIAYSPLDQGQNTFSQEKRALLNCLSKKYEKTPAQIALNWMIYGKGIFPIPKASGEAHMRDNVQAVSFRMEAGDYALVDQTFAYAPQMLSPQDIDMAAPDDRHNSKTYYTLEEARKNEYHLNPSPMQLAATIQEDPRIKPVRVRRRSRRSSFEKEYELLEGRLRYWAWVLAFGEQAEIPCLVREASADEYEGA